MPGDEVRGRGRARVAYDFRAFEGYRGPRFTPVPDEFLDHHLADLSSAEAKLMLYLFRKTYGYRKSADRISFSQLERGTRSSEGAIIDRGTGLSKATIWRALKGLEEKGLVEVIRQTTEAGDADVNHYRIREYQGPEERGFGPRSGGGPAPRVSPPSRGPRRDESPALQRPPGGSFTSETTPVSELNHPSFTSERGGGSATEQTREDLTTQNSTLTQDVVTLTKDFLRWIGYTKPARAKRERTQRILAQLARQEQYGLDELRAACAIAARLGARGPELIPHVVGQTVGVEEKVGERLVASEEEEGRIWRGLAEDFESLPSDEQRRLLEEARRSSPILAERADDHPLVKAAAMSLLRARSR